MSALWLVTMWWDRRGADLVRNGAVRQYPDPHDCWRNRTQEKSYPREIVPKLNGYEFSGEIVPWVRFLQRYRTQGTISPEITYPGWERNFITIFSFMNWYYQYSFRSFKTTWAGLMIFFISRDAFRREIDFSLLHITVYKRKILG